MNAHDKAAVLLEALPYIRKFAGKVFIIKYGGSFMDADDPAIRSSVASDIVFLHSVGIKPVVVHGGGKAISRALEAAGIKSVFIQGMRVTDEKSAGVVEEVLSRNINPEIVSMIGEFGGYARGFSGTEIFRCRKLLTPDGTDLGYVGEITKVETSAILKAVSDGSIPVISCTCTGEDGHIYNCNADVAAAEAAIALQVERLVFMSDVPGLLRDPNDSQSVISELRLSEVKNLKEDGVIDKGMIPKVDSAVRAINAGINKVSFVDGRLRHSILLEIFTDTGNGTVLAKN